MKNSANKSGYQLLDELCKHPDVIPYGISDEEFQKMSPEEIREKYPRRQCPKCCTVIYESFVHYICGDY